MKIGPGTTFYYIGVQRRRSALHETGEREELSTFENRVRFPKNERRAFLVLVVVVLFLLASAGGC